MDALKNLSEECFKTTTVLASSHENNPYECGLNSLFSTVGMKSLEASPDKSLVKNKLKLLPFVYS